MAQATAHGSHTEAHDRSGKHPPTSLGLNSRKLGLWVLIGNETLFFAALIATYLAMKPRNIALGGPIPQDYMDIVLTSILAFILLMSSLTMVLALAATERNDQPKIRLWLGATILLGLTFLGGQLYEYNHMFHEKFVPVEITQPDGQVVFRSVPEHEEEARLAELQEEFPGAELDPQSAQPVTWTTSMFGSTFFTMTGFHGTHVLIGAIWLSIVLGMALRGKIGPNNALTVEMAGLYWHFVDLVWVALFVLVYLIR